MRKIAMLVFAALVVPLPVACGSSSNDGAGNTPTARPASPTSNAPSVATSAATSALTSAATSSAPSDSFCQGLQPHGEGPADAFTVVPAFSPSQALKAAKDQLALMAGVNSPPAEIAKDWAAWKAYLVLVQKQAARISGSGLAAALAGPAKAVEPARARLEKYAFAHCQ